LRHGNERGSHVRADPWVDGGQHFGRLFEDGDAHAALQEGFGHLQPDVAGSDDHGSVGGGIVQHALELQRVVHRVEHVDTWKVDAWTRWADGHRARGDDQAVVAERVSVAGGPDLDDMIGRIDGERLVFEHEPHAGRLEFIAAAMREVPPICDLAAEQVRKAADAVVGEPIGDDNRDVDVGRKFADPYGSGDAGVASADDDDPHRAPPGALCT
jgi:hypothetical protein